MATHTISRTRRPDEAPEQVRDRIREATAQAFPLPEWPSHLPKPTVTYGISECGSDKFDMWLYSGERKVYFQIDDASRNKFYDDLNDDPDWAGESPQTKGRILSYAHTLLRRYDLAAKEVLTTREGRAYTALVWSTLTN